MALLHNFGSAEEEEKEEKKEEESLPRLYCLQRVRHCLKTRSVIV